MPRPYTASPARLLTLLLASVIPLTTPAAERPNIVLVMADDQGWGDMAYNGHPDLQTPNFDAFAREGVRFDNFYAAAPSCSPTRASVLTGRTPIRSAVFKAGFALRPQEVTLPELVRGAGYRTGLFGKWHLGSIQKNTPAHPGVHGFDTWVSAANFFDLDPMLSQNGTAVSFRGDSSDVTVAAALDFIRQCAAQDEPFLAMVWFGSPHDPHRALEADRKPYAHLPEHQQHFNGEVTAMDRAFGRLRSELRHLGLRDNTILWYCSDNGALRKVGSSGGRRGHKASLYEGGIAVPALLEWPGRIPSPQVVETPGVTSDILPTVLQLAGLELPADRPLDGISLAPVLTGRADARSRPIGFWNSPDRVKLVHSDVWLTELYAAQQEGRETDDPARLYLDAAEIREQLPIDRFSGHAAWIEGHWKLHRIESEDTGEVTWELYNLEDDFREEKDLIGSEKKRADSLRQGLETWLGSVVRSHNGADY